MKSPPRLAPCLLLAFAVGCSGEDDGPDAGPLGDASVAPDSGQAGDAGADDAAATDTGAPVDAGFPDAAPMDAGFPDATPPDAGFPDAAPADTGFPDAAPMDAGFPDAAPADAGFPDAAPMDAGFPDAAPMDAGFPDAAPMDAGASDAGAPTGCDVAVAPPEANAGQVGASGGSPGPFLECPAGAEVVGVAVRISDQNTANGAPSAVGFTLACAPVTVSPTGATVGAETLPEVMGSGQFGWSPATQSTITRCPPGWVVSGLSGSRGASGNLFLDVTVTCTELSATGAVGPATQDIYVTGSLMSSAGYDTVTCAAGQVVRRMGTRIGAGLDAVSLFCATPACAP